MPEKLPSFAGYRSWTRVTKSLVPMDPEIAALCRSVKIDDPNIGPHAQRSYYVYVNSVGKKAMLAKEAITYPPGTIIVKEKYHVVGGQKGVGKPELLTVMIKGKKGSQPATGDWTFLVANADGSLAESKIDHCVRCHEGQKDWVFRGYPVGSPKHAR